MLFLFLKYFSWLYAKPRFRVLDANKIKAGSIVVTYKAESHSYETWIALSGSLRIVDGCGFVSHYFLSMRLNRLTRLTEPSAYCPESRNASEMGIEQYRGGKMHKTHRSFLIPYSVSNTELAEIVSKAKNLWRYYINQSNYFMVSGSPFVD